MGKGFFVCQSSFIEVENLFVVEIYHPCNEAQPLDHRSWLDITIYVRISAMSRIAMSE